MSDDPKIPLWVALQTCQKMQQKKNVLQFFNDFSQIASLGWIPRWPRHSKYLPRQEDKLKRSEMCQNSAAMRVACRKRMQEIKAKRHRLGLRLCIPLTWIMKDFWPSLLLDHAGKICSFSQKGTWSGWKTMKNTYHGLHSHRTLCHFPTSTFSNEAKQKSGLECHAAGGGAM